MSGVIVWLIIIAVAIVRFIASNNKKRAQQVPSMDPNDPYFWEEFEKNEPSMDTIQIELPNTRMQAGKIASLNQKENRRVEQYKEGGRVTTESNPKIETHLVVSSAAGKQSAKRRFDLRNAVIYSEILKAKHKEY